ncbi:MAG: CDP-diacylglycerol--serine O-phosphatidyltransferase [Cyclobacteriaceae bacterium]
MKRHIPNAITCLNLATGAVGCIFIIQGAYHQAFYFVLVAAFFDFLDGLFARLLGVQSPIGKELDSLADMVSFGLLPALYLVMSIDFYSPPSEYLKYIGLVVAMFSAIRLAKFNLDTRQTDQFIGLPTPANAILITSLSFLPADWSMNFYLMIGISILSAFLLVMEVPLIALKFKGLSWKSNQFRFVLIMVLAALIAFFQLAAIPLIIPCYLILSIIGNFSSQKSV